MRLAASPASLLAAVALSITACDGSVQKEGSGASGESSLAGGTGGAGEGGAGEGGAGEGGAGEGGAGGAEAGCVVNADCAAGLLCCSGACVDIDEDEAHCGACGSECADAPNAALVCEAGVCGVGACGPGFADCDQDPANGCERDTLADGPCVCAPGETQSCYMGAPETLGVGSCIAGAQGCNADGLGWGPCDGQVLPDKEVCGNQIDDDCDAATDENLDEDGDGFTSCDGDCCDSMTDCPFPEEVNAGAFERLNNGVDDDCAPETLDTEATADCSVPPLVAPVSALDIAMAADICQFTAENAVPSQRRWGLISAQFPSVNGSAPKDEQLAVLSAYGTGGIVPVKGSTIAGLSTGKMRDTATGYTATGGGTEHGRIGSPPPVFLAAHGGELPTAVGCPAGSGANDSVNVKLAIRVPTNADVLSYRYRFLTADYTSRVCSPYNDLALALLTTQAAGIPADTNILFDSVMSFAAVNTAFFEVCAPQAPGQCPLGIGQLAGTGLEINDAGAGTAWLTTEAPVVRGETIELEFMVFDVTDERGDSVLLLDGFEWVF